MQPGTLPPVGTRVLAGNGLGTVIRQTKRGAANGVDVQSPEYNGGLYTQFQQDWTIRRAVVGDTVCAQPRGTHFCGRLHVNADDLARLPRVDEASTPKAEA